MSKVITWATSKFNEHKIETNCLFYAENLIRHFNHTPPFNLKCCIKGEMRYTINKQNTVVPPGHVLFVNKETRLECRPAREGTRAFHVFFKADLMTQVAQYFQAGDNQLLDNPELPANTSRFFSKVFRPSGHFFESLSAIAQQISVSNTSKDNIPTDIFYSLAANIFALQADFSKHINRINARSANTREELFRRMLKAKDFMHDHWRTALTLEEIARVACLSPYHFHRSFQNAYGHPPMKYFRNIKLEYAKKLLSAHNMNVSQVAFECGFSDVFSFSKAFKRVYQVNPSAIDRPGAK